MDQELKLNEFKVAFTALKTGVPWVDYLLLGLLCGIEQWYIQVRVVTEVNRAIKDYEDIEIVTPVSPVYTEKPSETSTSLPEMRLTAPWYIDEVESH